jgi:hypothetical protein
MSDLTPKQGRDPDGRFATGNRLWEARSSAGPKPKFDNPDKLWAACVEYFEWVEANPLMEAKAFAFQGVVTQESIPKMRAMTLGGLCLFLDIGMDTWIEWRKTRSDLSKVITQAEAVIYQQKFTGAAADLLNANIISRELGLADRSEITGKDGGPIETKDTSGAEKLAEFLNGIAERGAKAGDADA